MSLREEMWKYEQITGESAEHVPIIKLGAFLDGYEMGLKALEQQPYEDCISRTETLKHSHIEYDDDGEGHRVVYCEDIEQMPPVQPQRKKGKWISMEVSSGRDSWKCSLCGRRARGKKENLPFCHCGADMKEVEE